MKQSISKEQTLDGSRQHETQYSYELQHCEARLHPLDFVFKLRSYLFRFICEIDKKIDKMKGGKLTDKKTALLLMDSSEKLNRVKGQYTHNLHKHCLQYVTAS